jgi:hypothetical protein
VLDPARTLFERLDDAERASVDEIRMRASDLVDDASVSSFGSIATIAPVTRQREKSSEDGAGERLCALR